MEAVIFSTFRIDIKDLNCNFFMFNFGQLNNYIHAFFHLEIIQLELTVLFCLLFLKFCDGYFLGWMDKPNDS